MNENFASQKSEEKAMRCFVAVPLSEGTRHQALGIQQTLGRKSSLKSIRWTRPEGLHITLKFLGRVPLEDVIYIAQQLSIVAQGCWPTEIQLDQLDIFPSLQRPRVLLWGTNRNSISPEFQAIHFHVQEAMQLLGYEKEDRPFRPHVTLGRMKESANPEHLAETIKKPNASINANIPIRQFDLMESRLHPEGAIYESLAEIQIKPKQSNV